MSDVPYCTCGTDRSRQNGYTCINVETNDWGCGRCRKPMKIYHDTVIRPREEATNAAH